MKCTYCNAELEYGYQYCIKCGERVEKSVIDTAYNETFWGKADAFIQKYENNKLKKITGNYLFRTLVLIVSLVLIFFGFGGNEYRLRILDNDAYKIQYDMNKEEFYVLSNEQEFVLDIHIPKFCSRVRLICHSGDDVFEKVMERGECQISVVRNEFDYITLEAMCGEIVVQSLKFSAP